MDIIGLFKNVGETVLSMFALCFTISAVFALAAGTFYLLKFLATTFF